MKIDNVAFINYTASGGGARSEFVPYYIVQFLVPIFTISSSTMRVKGLYALTTLNTATYFTDFVVIFYIIYI